MKKLLLSTALMCISLFTFAQLPSFGIKGGANFATLNVSADDANVTLTTGSLTTFSVSAFADFKFGNVSIQPAVSYTGKGGQADLGNNNSGQVKLYYVQVPVNLVYHVPVGVGNVYFGAGPYVAFGTSGKLKTNNASTDIHFGDGADQVKSTDFGANGIAGFEFSSGLLLGVNYDLGLSDIGNNNGSSIKNRVFGVSAGFKF